MTTRRLALFDLDHTLLPLDSDYQWADFWPAPAAPAILPRRAGATTT